MTLEEILAYPLGFMPRFSDPQQQCVLCRGRFDPVERRHARAGLWFCGSCHRRLANTPDETLLAAATIAKLS